MGRSKEYQPLFRPIYPNDLEMLVSEALREFNSRRTGVGMVIPF